MKCIQSSTLFIIQFILFNLLVHISLTSGNQSPNLPHHALSSSVFSQSFLKIRGGKTEKPSSVFKQKKKTSTSPSDQAASKKSQSNPSFFGKNKNKKNTVNNIPTKKNHEKKESKGKKAIAVVYSPEEQEKISKRQKMIISIIQTTLSIASMYFTRVIFKFDYRNPRILGLARVAFVGYLVLMQLVYLLLRCLILYRKDETILPSSGSSFKNPLMSMLGGKNNPLAGLLGSALGGGGAGEEKKVKVYEYDSQENYKLYQKLFFEILTTSVMHFVFKRHSSLLIVPLMGIANRLKEPLILIHFFRFKPFGSLARPFKSAMEMAMEDLVLKQEEEEVASAETTSEEQPKIETSKESKSRQVKKEEEEEEEEEAAPLEVKEGDDEEMELVLEEVIEEEEWGEDNEENGGEEDEDGDGGSDEQELEELLDSLDAIDPLKKP